MPAGLSAYLDFLRVGAALMVLLNHVWPMFIKGPMPPWPAHHAVIVFFVLSGFVVAYVTATKERAFARYALSRTARILSVTVPALAFATVLALATGEPPHQVWWGTFLNFFFVAQNWSLAVLPTNDPPYWSLCYEVWYYAIFAAAVFPATMRAKLLWTAGLCVLAGPKILLLMPVWLAGVALYHNAGRVRLSERGAVAIFLATVLVYAVFFWFDISVHIRGLLNDRYRSFMVDLDGSNQFAGDYLLAPIVAANFLAVYHMTGAFARWFARHKRAVSAAASNTLSIYLFHYPAAVLLHRLGVASWLGVPLALALCVALAPLTEHRKTWLRNTLRGWLTGGGTPVPAPAPNPPTGG